MSKKSLDKSGGIRLYEEFVARPDSMPFTFKYGKDDHRGLAGLETETVSTVSSDRLTRVFTAMLDKNVRIKVETAFVPEFSQSEYTVWFENTGSEVSEAVSALYALDHEFAGSAPALRGILGDHDNFYAAYEHDLTKSDQFFQTEEGRASHVVFPYFDLMHGDGGTMIALGWGGTWNALFSDDAPSGKVSVKAKTSIRTDTVLLPGEKIRTGLIVMLPYKGRDYSDATNLWREWYMKYNMPKANAAGDPIVPFSTLSFVSDSPDHRPGLTGSTGENHRSWRPTLEKARSEGLAAEFRWIDTGWFIAPNGDSVDHEWWNNVGTWEIDRTKWPEGTFREMTDACREAGMKVFVWFEPERVTDVPNLVKKFGYREEWSLMDYYSRANNIGIPECLDWTYRRIVDFMEENGVDMLREDNNNEPKNFWITGDDRSSDEIDLKRNGITENKFIQGHYELWDRVIAYCAENGKCTYVDNCASGGGRFDIESMRRSVPMMRSDFDSDRFTRLSQTTGLCRWLPFHGSGTKDGSCGIAPRKGPGISKYVFRASYLPILNTGWAFNLNPDLDLDLIRLLKEEWRSISHLLVKDMYILTPWRHRMNRRGWTAIAYDDPEAGESVLLAFRPDGSDRPEYRARLQFAVPGRFYSVTDADTGITDNYSADELADEGIPVRLDEPRSSALLRIRRLPRD